MNRLQLIWSNLRTSIWFLPSLIFVASIAVAIGLIDADSGNARPWIAQWPRFFGAGAAGARGMLSTIAGSMMTVVGVTFSMTLVTLALAACRTVPMTEPWHPGQRSHRCPSLPRSWCRPSSIF